MGAGGEASKTVAERRYPAGSKLNQVKDDLTVLKSLWFNKVCFEARVLLATP